MKFAGKWMELEFIILREVTQTLKDTHHMYSYVDISHKVLDNHTRIHRPQKGK